MSDIHGCCNEFLSMLDKIGFSDMDRLIIAGDHIDRGTQSYEMLKWIEKCPPNVTLLRGNHEEKFIEYIEIMLMLDRDKSLGTDIYSNNDARALYESVKYFLRSAEYVDFDKYGTINSLIFKNKVTIAELHRWADIFLEMLYYEKININGRTCVAVHAGYSNESEKIKADFPCMEDFYLYAREESYLFGGIPHGIIIAGHTPTIAENKFAYNCGNIFRHYNVETDCIFYDIDCGCAFRDIDSDAKLACIRVEDEKIFYV